VDRVLADPGIRRRAAQLGAALDAAGGTTRAGDLLDALIATSSR
jgi:UDP:flavonoid glycosyltransferase YjiC (YdhE family)